MTKARKSGNSSNETSSNLNNGDINFNSASTKSFDSSFRTRKLCGTISEVVLVVNDRSSISESGLESDDALQSLLRSEDASSVKELSLVGIIDVENVPEDTDGKGRSEYHD